MLKCNEELQTSLNERILTFILEISNFFLFTIKKNNYF